MCKIAEEQKVGVFKFYRKPILIVLLLILGILVGCAVVAVVYVDEYAPTIGRAGHLPRGPVTIQRNEDDLYLSSAAIRGRYSVPLTIEEITVRDMDTGERFSPTIYVGDMKDEFAREGGGMMTLSKFLSIYGRRTKPLRLAAEGQLIGDDKKFYTNQIGVFVLFHEFPFADDQRVEVVCKYKLFGILPRTMSTNL